MFSWPVDCYVAAIFESENPARDSQDADFAFKHQAWNNDAGVSQVKLQRQDCIFIRTAVSQDLEHSHGHDISPGQDPEGHPAVAGPDSELWSEWFSHPDQNCANDWDKGNLIKHQGGVDWLLALQ